METFKCFREEESVEYPTTIRYCSKTGGYQATTRTVPVGMVVPTQEEFFRYLAGERTHLFPGFDPKKHMTYAKSWQPEQNNYTSIPIILSEIVEEMDVSIPHGCFHLLEGQSSPYLKQFTVSTDGYIDLGKSEYESVYSEFCEFRKDRAFYESERRRHRSSALLYGPPGNGKTREICRILQNSERDKFRAIFIGSSIKNLMALEPFRKPLDNDDTVFVIEEITERTNDKTLVDQLLSFLDGELSWNHSFVIATTNYPELLEMNIIERPGRFKTKLEIPSPNAVQRLKYLVGCGLTERQAADAAWATEGLSIDYLGSIVFDHKKTGKSFATLVQEMKANRRKISKRFKNTMGLSSDGTVPDAAQSVGTPK